MIHWPQMIWISIVLISVGMEIAKHGEPKEGDHDAWSTIIAAVLLAALLYWGGFFGC